MEKDFTNWHEVKSCLNNTDNTLTFKEREVWWTCIGTNIGHETDGKGKKFNRPVLIVKKFNHRLFWGVPLTTQIKNSPHYYKFCFHDDRERCAMLTQLRLWDAKRLTHQIGRLSQKHHHAICAALTKYIEVKR